MREYFENFIPFFKEDVISFCKDFYNEEEKQKFSELCEIIEMFIHHKFLSISKSVQGKYIEYNPDVENYFFFNRRFKDKKKFFLEEIRELLIKANYNKVSGKKLKEAISKSSPWGINFKIDFDKLDFFELYFRGEREDSITKKKFIKKKDYQFEVYSRIVFIFKPREEIKVFENVLSSENIYLKVFKNVPELDLEMIFPSRRIKIRRIDIAKVSLPLIGGIGFSIYKFLSFLLASGSDPNIWFQISFWIVLFGLFSYSLRSFTEYKSLVERYLKNLSTNLYLQNLNNGAGAITYLINEAEIQEFNEIIILYSFLYKKKRIRANEINLLDKEIENYFEKTRSNLFDFESDDALKKLRDLNLVVEDNEYISVKELNDSLLCIDKMWDNIYEYGKDN